MSGRPVEGVDEKPRRVGKNRVGQIPIYTPLQKVNMSVGVTSLGPVEPAIRDAVAEYRDEHDHPNYNSALKAMLEEVNAD